MTFWALAGVMTMAVVALLLVPLLRRPARWAARRDYHMAVYRDQLAEIERDLTRGVLTDGQAVAARTEIERRLLAAADRAPEPGRDQRAPAGRVPASGRGRNLAAGLTIGLPAAAVGLYLALGAPGVPSAPFAERPVPEQTPPDMIQMVEGLAERMAQSPDDPAGWRLLGRSYIQLGRFDQAVEALRQAIAKGSDEAQVWASLGEALVAANGGRVVPGARTAFAAVLERDPGEPRARYYGGLALAQDGRLRQAMDYWLALAADAPADAPWRAVVEEQARLVAADLGLDPADPALAALKRPAAGSDGGPSSGPSAADRQAVDEMTPEQRDDFIRSMVDGLAARLEENPDDLEGWLRLIRAYQVLGETERATAAVQRAATLAASLPPDAPERRAVEAARRALDAAPRP